MTCQKIPLKGSFCVFVSKLLFWRFLFKIFAEQVKILTELFEQCGFVPWHVCLVGHCLLFHRRKARLVVAEFETRISSRTTHKSLSILEHESKNLRKKCSNSIFNFIFTLMLMWSWGCTRRICKMGGANLEICQMWREVEIETLATSNMLDIFSNKNRNTFKASLFMFLNRFLWKFLTAYIADSVVS